MFLWSVNVINIKINIKMILCLRYLIRIPRTEYPDDEVGRVTCLRTSIPGQKEVTNQRIFPLQFVTLCNILFLFRATVVPQYRPSADRLPTIPPLFSSPFTIIFQYTAIYFASPESGGIEGGGGVDCI